MRIIAGELRSRRIKAPEGLAVRPTPDRLRESLFSVLGESVRGKVFLDAYAGSGSVGLEALSRGAKLVLFIERNGEAFATLRENIESLQVNERVTLLRGKAAAHLARYSPDISFVDPPYDEPAEYEASMGVLGDCPLVIAQHSARVVLEERYGRLVKTRVLRQGDNALSFFGPE